MVFAFLRAAVVAAFFWAPAPAPAPAHLRPVIDTDAVYGVAGFPGGWYVQQPPPRYRIALPDVTVTFVPTTEVSDDCASQGLGPPGKGVMFVACTTESHITLPDPCPFAFTGDHYAQIVCHEMAHVNGWPADHPLD